jgi:hypothetical protein
LGPFMVAPLEKPSESPRSSRYNPCYESLLSLLPEGLTHTGRPGALVQRQIKWEPTGLWPLASTPARLDSGQRDPEGADRALGCNILPLPPTSPPGLSPQMVSKCKDSTPHRHHHRSPSVKHARTHQPSQASIAIRAQLMPSVHLLIIFWVTSHEAELFLILLRATGHVTL